MKTALALAVGVWLILMGFWYAGMPSWIEGDINVGALLAAAFVFVLALAMQRK